MSLLQLQNKKLLLIILFAIVVNGLVIGGYYLIGWKLKSNKIAPTPTPVAEEIIDQTTPPVDPIIIGQHNQLYKLCPVTTNSFSIKYYFPSDRFKIKFTKSSKEQAKDFYRWLIDKKLESLPLTDFVFEN